MRPFPKYLQVLFLMSLCVTVVRLLLAQSIETSLFAVRAFGIGTPMSWCVVTLAIGVVSAVVYVFCGVVVDRLKASKVIAGK